MRILLLLLIAFQVVLPQVLTKSQFLDIAQESLNPAYLNTIEKYVPEDFNITALEIGDYTGDGKNDIAFGIRHKRDKGRNIFIFMMLIKEINMKQSIQILSLLWLFRLRLVLP